MQILKHLIEGGGGVETRKEGAWEEGNNKTKNSISKGTLELLIEHREPRVK